MNFKHVSKNYAEHTGCQNSQKGSECCGCCASVCSVNKKNDYKSQKSSNQDTNPNGIIAFQITGYKDFPYHKNWYNKGKYCLKAVFSGKKDQKNCKNEEKKKFLVQSVVIRHDNGIDRVPLIADSYQRFIACLINFILFQGAAEKVDACQCFSFKNSVFNEKSTGLLPRLYKARSDDIGIVCFFYLANGPLGSFINKSILIACGNDCEDADKNQAENSCKQKVFLPGKKRFHACLLLFVRFSFYACRMETAGIFLLSFN